MPLGFNKLYIGLEKRIKILLCHYPMQYIYANNLILVGLFAQTVLLIILFLGHLHSGNTKFGPGKCAHNLYIYDIVPLLNGRVASIQRKGTFFLGPETWLYFNLHYFSGHLSTQKVTDHKEG